MKKILYLMLILMVSGCASFSKGYKLDSRLQNEYFDENGKRAGYGIATKCIKQAMKETDRSYYFQYCGTSPECTELAEACMAEHGFFRPDTPETSAERMALYKKAYEEGWIKAGMTKKEVLKLLGAPQITGYQLIPPRKTWGYCRNRMKTTLIGFNFVLTIVWKDDKVESVRNVFIL